MPKKLSVLSIILLALVTVALVLAMTTYAIWREQVTAQENIQAEVAYYNPSLKHLIFRGLNEAGEYADTGIVAYAVIGYTGIVTEVEIPEVYSGYPVVAITIDPDNNKVTFQNSRVISLLIISKSVLYVDVSACSNMKMLTKVVVRGTEEDPPLEIRESAFSGCTSLHSFTAPDGRLIDNAPI